MSENPNNSEEAANTPTENATNEGTMTRIWHCIQTEAHGIREGISTAARTAFDTGVNLFKLNPRTALDKASQALNDISRICEATNDQIAGIWDPTRGETVPDTLGFLATEVPLGLTNWAVDGCARILNAPLKFAQFTKKSLGRFFGFS